MNDSTEFTIPKARQLVEEAHKPNAPLADISLCWEAMGPDILPVISPVMTDPNPEIAFAATRAAAFLHDVPARQELLRIASDSTQRFQIEAVQTLGALPNTPDMLHMLRQLLDSDKADVRIEAYRILAENDDEGIITHPILDSFYLDIIPSAGPPLVYATNTGVPRIAVFGHNVSLATPITFTAVDDRLSISSSDGTSLLTLFYRDPTRRQPLNVKVQNDLPMIVARLGGDGPLDEDSFSLTFNDVVAIVQRLVDGHQAYGQTLTGESVAAVFQLEHPQLASDSWISIPDDSDTGRPQGGGIVPVSPAATPVPSTSDNGRPAGAATPGNDAGNTKNAGAETVGTGIGG